jgi:predicted  nucleic acid-binding Zn-ribbon protein
MAFAGLRPVNSSPAARRLFVNASVANERDADLVAAFAHAGSSTRRHDGRSTTIDPGTVLQDSVLLSPAAPPVTDLPPHLWKVPVADGIDSQLRHVAALPDGRVVAAFRRNGAQQQEALAVWDAQLTRQAGPSLLSPGVDRPSATSSNAVCTALAVVSEDVLWCGWASGHVTCYSTTSCDLIECLYAHRGAVLSIAAPYSALRFQASAASFGGPDIQRVVTSAADHQVLLWDAQTRQVLRSLSAATGPAANRGQSRVAVCSLTDVLIGYDSGAVLRWSLLDEGLPADVTKHRTAVTAVTVQCSATCEAVWSGCDEGVVRLSAANRPAASLSLNCGRVTAIAPYQAIEMSGGHSSRRDDTAAARVALIGTASGRLLGLRAIDSTTLAVLFMFDTRVFSPPVGAARPRSDGSSRGGSVSPITAIELLSPLTATVVLASGAAFTLLSGTAYPVHQSSHHQRQQHPVQRQPAFVESDDQASSDDWRFRCQAVEGRYERLLRKVHAMARVTKEQVLRHKVAKEATELALSRASARAAEMETQCSSLTDALQSVVTEMEHAKSGLSTSMHSEAKLMKQCDALSSNLRAWEAKAFDLKEETSKQHAVLEALRQERDRLRAGAQSDSSALAEATRRNADLDAQLQSAQSELQQLRATADSNRKRAVHAETRAEEAEDGLRDAVRQLRTLTAECQSLHRTVADLEAKLRTAQKMNSDLTVDLARIRGAAPQLTHPSSDPVVAAYRPSEAAAVVAENERLRRQFAMQQVSAGEAAAYTGQSRLVSPPRVRSHNLPT